MVMVVAPVGEGRGLPHSRAGGTGGGSSLASSQNENSKAAMAAMPRTGWKEKVGQLAPGMETLCLPVILTRFSAF